MFMKFAKSYNKVLETENFLPYPKRYRLKDIWAEREGKSLQKMSENERDEYIKNRKHDRRYDKNGFPKDGFNHGGYEWALHNWGTKWGICHPEIIKKPFINLINTRVTYRFDTAWSPPNLIIIKMSKMFKKLRFELRYWEGGSGFQGKTVCTGGDVVEATSQDYIGHRGG